MQWQRRRETHSRETYNWWHNLWTYWVRNNRTNRELNMNFLTLMLQLTHGSIVPFGRRARSRFQARFLSSCKSRFTTDRNCLSARRWSTWRKDFAEPNSVIDHTMDRWVGKVNGGSGIGPFWGYVRFKSKPHRCVLRRIYEKMLKDGDQLPTVV